MTSISIQPMNLNAEAREAYFQKKEAEYDTMIGRWKERIAEYEAKVAGKVKGSMRADKNMLKFCKEELKVVEHHRAYVRLNGGVW
jgi:hypothetical protein